MIEYIGNSMQVIDWDEVINTVKDQTPSYIGPSHKREDNIPGLDEVFDIWDRVGYKLLKDGGTVGWDMFLPDVNFDRSIVEKFADFVGLEDYNSAWISRINPGNFAAYHWDVHDNEEELSKLPDVKRWHCHIGKPEWGHVFCASDKCFYNQEQGATYVWHDRKLWHAGSNCGLEPKYLFNFW